MASEPLSSDLWVPLDGERVAAPSRDWSWPDRASWGGTRLFLLTAASYALGSLPAQFLINESGLSAVFFIPAGISVAFLLRLPRRWWWVVLAAVGSTEAVLDLAVGYPVVAVAGFVAGNVVEPLVGASIVRHWCGQVDLARLRHLGWFLLGAVFAATAFGAAIGSVPVYLIGEAELPNMFLQWWLGDAVGVLIIGSAILAWGSSPDHRSLVSPWGVMLLAGMVVVMVAVIRTELPLTFLVLIGVVLAGAVFGTRAVAAVGLVVAITYALEIAYGSRILIVGIPDETALLIIKLRLGVFTLAGLIVAAEAFEAQLAGRDAAEATALTERLRAESRLERQIAVRLQRALLPDKPLQHPKVAAAARYEAASEAMLVGGDWYDVLPLPRGRIGLTVGDVVGHGLEASAAMGRMRTAVSVLALRDESPGRLLTHLDEFARGPEGTEFATAVFATLDPASGMVTYASAGHPPMLVIDHTGSSRWLNGGRSQPLHGGVATHRGEASERIDPGSLLVAFSDGLVERRGEDLMSGMRRLEEAASYLSGRAPDEVCDLLIEGLGVAETRDDDVVVLVLRFGWPPEGE
jgi:serine phosphatase RsbU (regulator of sigma subunit)